MRKFGLWILLAAVISSLTFATVSSLSRAQEPVAPPYVLGRPIPPPYQDRQQYGFPYGSTRNGRSPVHHGIDILNRLGTPVIAAADGTVFFAGDDKTQAFGPGPEFYGNLVILMHDITAPEGGALYTLYGHLSRTHVKAGQRVTQGQHIGNVGRSGIAIGDHLHFEVRVGNPTDYNAVRNPELWFPPKPGTGKIIGRMVDHAGGLAMDIRFLVTTGSSVFSHYTYANAAVPSLPQFRENFVVGDLTAGCYRLRVRNNLSIYAYDEPFCIRSGETRWMDVKLQPFS